MDFTPLYPLSSPTHLLFSPGSTFVLSLITHDDPPSSATTTSSSSLTEGSPTATLVVRAASDLSLVRSWPLALGGGEAASVALSWSPDGGYILVSNSKKGTVDVYVLDPRRQPVFSTSGEDGEQSTEAQAVAHLDLSSTGGFVQACWAPGSGLVVPPSIFCFAGEDVGIMTAHCLASGGGSDDSGEGEVSRTRSVVFRDVKKSRCWPHPSDKGRFALLHRDVKSGVEKVGVYRAVVGKGDGEAAGSSNGSRSSAGAYTAILQGKTSSSSSSSRPQAPTVDWELETSFPCHTNDAAGLSWSPDGNLIAVWEGPLEYRLHVFTALGATRGILAHSGEAAVSGVRVREPSWVGMPSEDGEGEAAGAGSNEASTSSSSPRLGASLRASTTAASRSTRSSARTASGQGDAAAAQQDGATTLAAAAAGGLGIRTVAWRPTPSSTSTSNGRRHASTTAGNMLTITGFDERIYLLSQEATTGQWHLITPPSSPTSTTTTPSSLAHLDLTRRPLTSPLPYARIYREPRDWVTLTGGRGIVPFHSSPLSGGSAVNPPTLKPDWEKLTLHALAAAPGGSGGSGARAGIQWMDWDPLYGQYLAVRSESMPSTLLVYELQSGATGSGGATLQLLSVLLFAASVSSVAWRPASAAAGAGPGAGQGEAQPQLSIVSSSSPAIYLWTAPPSSLPQHDREAEPAAPIVEGVPVPVPAAPLSATSSSHSATAMDFRPSGLRWSPDGAKVAVASAREGAAGGGVGATGAYCVATHAEDEEESEV